MHFPHVRCIGLPAPACNRLLKGRIAPMLTMTCLQLPDESLNARSHLSEWVQTTAWSREWAVMEDLRNGEAKCARQHRYVGQRREEGLGVPSRAGLLQQPELRLQDPALQPVRAP